MLTMMNLLSVLSTSKRESVPREWFLMQRRVVSRDGTGTQCRKLSIDGGDFARQVFQPYRLAACFAVVLGGVAQPGNPLFSFLGASR